MGVKYTYELFNKLTEEIIDLETPRLDEAINKVGDMFKVPLESIKLKFTGLEYDRDSGSTISYHFGFDNWVIVGTIRGDNDEAKRAGIKEMEKEIS